MRPALSLTCFAVLALTAVPAAAQNPAPPQSHSDAYWYGRFGYGTITGEPRFGGLSLGFGRRIERNAVGLDVLLFRGQAKLFGTQPDLHQMGGVYTHAYSGSLMTVKGLYFVRPRSRTTAYVGAGAGWGAVDFGRRVDIDEQWHGKGLEGELSVGYALARAPTSTRFFVQADITLPFYTAQRYSNRVVVVGDRYAPSLVVSLGAGW
jgi:opacity protein-like surface antigen